MKKTIAGLAFVAGCTILLTGCEKERITSMAARNVGPIRVAVQASDLTKSMAVTTPILEASNGFVLDVWANDTWYELYDSYATETDKKNYGLPDKSKKHDAGIYIDSDGKANVKYSTGNIPDSPGHGHDSEKTDGWYIVDGTGVETYNWITGPTEDMDPEYKFYLRFWARFPQDSEINGTLTVTDPALNSSTETFTYKLPYVPGSDATLQNDLLFAYAEVNQDHTAPKTSPDYPYWPDFPTPSTQNYVNLTFNHPLSMIRFCVSPDDGTFDVNLKIKSITITNVPNGGTCVFDGKKTSVDAGMFTWTPSTTLSSYREDYNASFKTAPSGWKGSEYATDKHIYTCNKAFMLIPHSPKFGTAGSSSNAQITIVFEDADLHEFTRTVDINPSGTSFEWLPGYYYTYRIKATKIGREVATMVYLDDWTNPYHLIPIS